MTALLGALVGALVAGVFTVAGHRMMTRNEHATWLRQERLRAYGALIEASILAMGLHDSQSAIEVLTMASKAAALVVLIGPRDGALMAYAIVKAIGDDDYDALTKARFQFTTFAQDVLRSKQ